MIVVDVSLRHVDEIGINNLDCIDRVDIIVRKWEGIAETRQQSIDTHLISGEIKEILGSRRLDACQNHYHCYE